jgi:hypothetical protein
MRKLSEAYAEKNLFAYCKNCDETFILDVFFAFQLLNCPNQDCRYALYVGNQEQIEAIKKDGKYV